MIYKTRDVKVGSKWDCNEYGVIEVSSYDTETFCFVSESGVYGEYDFIEFIQVCRPHKHSNEGELKLLDKGMTVGQLLNDNLVVVILTEGVYKGGYTTTVKYELADFMDDEPPFIEVSFITKQGDTVFFTEDLSQPVYELDGLLVVKAKGV